MAIMFVLLLVVHCVVRVASDDFDMTSFKTNVIDDERVWLVEFYSTMCGSCKEFSGVWSKIEASMKSIETTKINIDHPDGMEVAKALRVLDEGVPNVRLLNSRTNSNGVTVMSGMFEKSDKLSSFTDLVHHNLIDRICSLNSICIHDLLLIPNFLICRRFIAVYRINGENQE